MKTKLIILGLATYGLVTFGQDNSPKPATQDPPAEAPPVVVAQADPAAPKPDAPKPDAAAATPAATPGPGPGDIVPLIVIDEVPLTDAIRNLARQSNLNFQFDPKITSSNQPYVIIRLETVTEQVEILAVHEIIHYALHYT